jgi:hypothetical protein
MVSPAASKPRNRSSQVNDTTESDFHTSSACLPPTHALEVNMLTGSKVEPRYQSQVPAPLGTTLPGSRAFETPSDVAFNIVPDEDVKFKKGEMPACHNR